MLRPTPQKISRLQETRAARDYGGRTTPASGSQWHSKGDVKTLNWLIECKCTTKSSYPLKAETWLKINTEAILENKDPMMEIEFIDRGVSLVVLDKNDFLAITQEQRLREEIGS